MTDYKLFQAHLRLLKLSAGDLHAYYDAVDAADPEVANYHQRRQEKARRRERRFYPNPGNSEVIMRNRVRRAKSFGLAHDGLYNSPVNRR